MKAIVVNERDNVATALEDLPVNKVVEVQVGGEVVSVTLLEAIPFGYKFAIQAIPVEHDIRKYGKAIGKSTTLIKVGAMVHSHNVDR
jgi:altronate dehydratase small subunit